MTVNNILGLDSAMDLTLAAPALKASGYAFVGRYVIDQEDSHRPGKALTTVEAEAISRAGLRIVSLYETNPTHASYFDRDQGDYDGARAFHNMENELGAPNGTPVYFTVDCDVAPAVVIPYFQAIGMYAPASVVGVYSSGAVCQALVDAGLVTYTWLAQSTGWSKSKDFTGWNIKQGPQQTICGILADTDTAQVDNYGDWSL